MTTKDELQSFNDFVIQQTVGDSSELKLPELFDLWMFQNTSDVDHAENIAAVNASINDYLSGERGTPAGQHSRELRNEFGIAKE